MRRIDQQPQPGLKELTGFAQKHWRIGAATFAGIALLGAIKYSDIFIPQKSNPISTIPPPHVDTGTMPSQSVGLQPEPQPVREIEIPYTKDMGRYKQPIEPNEETVVKREELKPIRVEVTPVGVVEQHGLITEKNFDRHFARVTKEELEELIKKNPGGLAFLFAPLSKEFSIGESKLETLTDDYGNPNLSLKIYAKKIAIVAPSDGFVGITINELTNKPLSVWISEKISETEFRNYRFIAPGENPELTPLVSHGSPIKKGEVFARFDGSGHVDNDRYKAPENQISSYMAHLKRIPPVQVTYPGGGRGIKNLDQRYITPSLSNHEAWIRTPDGRIAIPDIALPPIQSNNNESKPPTSLNQQLK